MVVEEDLGSKVAGKEDQADKEGVRVGHLDRAEMSRVGKGCCQCQEDRGREDRDRLDKGKVARGKVG